jgi:PAS domain S-box-containing protein
MRSLTMALQDPERVAAVRATGLLDVSPEEALDGLTQLAARVLHTPSALLTLIDDRHQWIKSAAGLPDRSAGRREAGLTFSFCKHMIRSGKPLVVDDARKHRLVRGSPAIRELGMIAYAGAPLVTREGHVLGGFAVVDHLPRQWVREELQMVEQIAGVATREIELLAQLRKTRAEAEALHDVEERLGEAARFRTLVEQSLVGVCLIRDGRLRYANPRLAEILGRPADELAEMELGALVPDEHREELRACLARLAEGDPAGARIPLRLARPGGGLLHLDVYARAVEADGAPAVVGMVVDETEQHEARRALRISEERYRSFFEDDITGDCVISPEGRIEACNPAFARIFGFATPAAAVGAGAELVLAGGETREAVFAEIRARRKLEVQEVELRRPGGGEVPVLRTLAGVFGEDSALVEVRGYLFDITPRRAAEAAIREQEARWQLVARATNDVIRDWNMRTGRLTWSDAARPLLRYADAELGAAVEWWYERIHPDDRERVASGIQAVIDSVGDTWSAEYRFLRGDGSYASVLDRACVVRSDRGVPVRMIGAMMDVTERRRVEEAQRCLAGASAVLTSSLDYEFTLPALARLVVPTLADVCLVDVLDSEGVVRRLAGSHEVRRMERLLAAEPPAGGLAEHVVRTGEPVLVGEFTEDAADGFPLGADHRRWLRRLGVRSLMVAPLSSRDHVLGAVTLAATDPGRRYGPLDLMVAEDLARRIATAIDNAHLYEAAQQAAGAREQVLGVVSHDLRNPLNTIAVGTSLLLESVDERRSENRRWLEVIARAAEQMGRMIGDLLDLSSIDAGRFAVAPSLQDTRATLRDACGLLEPLAEEKGVRLEYAAADGLPPVWMDPHQIERVMSNLVGNAIKFTPAGGTITVTAEAAGDEVRVRVADTGPGISAEHLPHVFDRYWQVRRGDRRGTGLGLAIARGIVEAHGGKIWAESPPGSGAVFTFTLPLREPAHPLAEAVTAA